MTMDGELVPTDAALETTTIFVVHPWRAGVEGGAYGRRAWRGKNHHPYFDSWPEAELTAVFDARGRLVRVDVRYPGDGEA